MIICDLGIMVHNEEKNIGHLLKAILAEKSKKVRIARIFIVASGCTDQTVPIVKKFIKKDRRIKLLIQKKREGKASAINLFIQKAKSSILILESGDTIPKKNAFEKLVEPFSNPQIGMTGAHMMPIDNPQNFWGFVTHLQWDLHHKISLKQPKMGELVAFRKIFVQIPKFSCVDEANIEPLIRGQDFLLKYVPEAIVYNKGPENLHDFLKQRRRIYAGHLALKKGQGYEVATMDGLKIFLIFLQNLKPNFKYLFWSLATIIFEIWGRILGFWDYYFSKKSHTIWERSETTKKLIE